MIDFVSYVVFITIGAVLGAIVGRRFMRWAWHQSAAPERKSWLELAILVILVAVYAARQRW